MGDTKSEQIHVRVDESLAAWVDGHVAEAGSRASFVREVLRDEMERERERELRVMFDRAAEELTEEDLEEREDLVEAFSGRE